MKTLSLNTVVSAQFSRPKWRQIYTPRIVTFQVNSWLQITIMLMFQNLNLLEWVCWSLLIYFINSEYVGKYSKPYCNNLDLSLFW